VNKVLDFISAMWAYYVLRPWYYYFPPKGEDDPGDDATGQEDRPS
jgi:hypothetical protein